LTMGIIISIRTLFFILYTGLENSSASIQV
jgi:hypothetical protein